MEKHKFVPTGQQGMNPDYCYDCSLHKSDPIHNVSLWGVYCPQHYGSWHTDRDGRIYSYPSKEVAEAHIEVIRANPYSEGHLWKAVEFGKQSYYDPYKVAEGKTAGEVIEICPIRHPAHYTEAY